MFMKDSTKALAAWISLVPYVAVVWAASHFLEVGFWSTKGVLVAVRTFFSIVETLGGMLAWGLVGKRRAVEGNLALLRTTHFPLRYFGHDGFLAYLARIEDDDALPAATKAAAREWEKVLVLFEEMGVIAGMRMHKAAELALEAYSPRAAAPAFGEVRNALPKAAAA